MFVPIVAAVVGTMDITVKAQSVLAADRVKRQLIVEVSLTYSQSQMLGNCKSKLLVVRRQVISKLNCDRVNIS